MFAFSPPFRTKKQRFNPSCHPVPLQRELDAVATTLMAKAVAGPGGGLRAQPSVPQTLLKFTALAIANSTPH